MSHLRELERRLRQANVEISAIVAQIDPLPVELRRARNQVLTRAPREAEWSDAMRHTPRQRRYAYALRGLWPCFPASPASYAARLASQFATRRWFSENQSFGLARKLDTFVDEVASVIQQDRYAQAQAMLRAFLTVVIELMEVADDSFGCLGDSFRNGFAPYLAMPLDATGIDTRVFFQDLLMLLIWEDYGLTYEQTEGYFAGLTPEERDRHGRAVPSRGEGGHRRDEPDGFLRRRPAEARDRPHGQRSYANAGIVETFSFVIFVPFCDYEGTRFYRLSSRHGH